MDRNYYYTMDKEGKIWHEGTEITDPKFVSLIHRNMQKTENGYLVRCQGENCYFTVEDAPYVIQDLAFYKDEAGRLERVDLIFPGGFTEALDPSTLFVSPENVLYCTVRNSAFRARFSRKAFFQLTPYVQEAEGDSYFITIGGRRYVLGAPAHQ